MVHNGMVDVSMPPQQAAKPEFNKALSLGDVDK